MMKYLKFTYVNIVVGTNMYTLLMKITHMVLLNHMYTVMYLISDHNRGYFFLAEYSFEK